MSIYLLQNGKQTGPFPVDQLHQSVQTGLVPGDTLAWTDGLTDWEPISSLIAGYEPKAHPVRTAPARKVKKKDDAPWWAYILKGIATFAIGYYVFNLGIDYFLASKRTSAAPKTAQAATAGHIELMVTKVAPLSFGAGATSTQLNVQVTNQSSSAFRLVSLDVQGLDAAGSILANSTKAVENIGPNQTRKLEVSFFGVLPDKISRINVVAQNATAKKGDGTLVNVQPPTLTMIPFDEAHGNVLSLEAARKHAPGTWTGNDNRGTLIRLVLNADGTTIEFTAMPSSDNWGKGTPGSWEAFTGKFDDSGTRYYGLKLNRGGYTIFQSATVMILPNLNMALTKGDQFPFSK